MFSAFDISQHKLAQAQQHGSSHCQPRSEHGDVELVVIHCISLPENKFGTGAPIRLFNGVLDCQEHESFADLEGVRVSAHLLIERDGSVHQFVPFDQAAWHAGVSSWCGRAGCNDFSIGIELEGSVSQQYEAAQYEVLHEVLLALLQHYPGLSIGNIVGHSDVASGRKQDPGPFFKWAEVYGKLHATLAGRL